MLRTMNERSDEGHPTDDEWDSPAWNDFMYGHLQGAMTGGERHIFSTPLPKNKLKIAIGDIKTYIKWTLEDWKIVKLKP